jgi:hypothetical protein
MRWNFNFKRRASIISICVIVFSWLNSSYVVPQIVRVVLKRVSLQERKFKVNKKIKRINLPDGIWFLIELSSFYEWFMPLSLFCIFAEKVFLEFRLFSLANFSIFVRKRKNFTKNLPAPLKSYTNCCLFSS